MAEVIREGNIPISGWVFIILGAVMAAYSKTMEANGNDSLILFFYAGLALVLYGVGKLAFKAFTKKEKKDEKSAAQKTQADIARRRAEWQRKQQLVQQHRRQQMQQQAIIACPKCSARNWNTSKFCHQCGSPL